jgi:hypothetical protein
MMGVLRSELMRLLPPDVEQIKPYLATKSSISMPLSAKCCSGATTKGSTSMSQTGGSPQAGTSPTTDSSTSRRRSTATCPSPRGRLGGSRRNVDRQLERDMRRMGLWLFLVLAERDLVIWPGDAEKALSPQAP